jgi:c-di-GMP-binding flagellar brake protein YcgR
MPFKERLGDRRTDLRFEIIGQLWGSLETVEHLPLRNLARGGALIESRMPLTAEMVRAVRLVFNGTTHDIEAKVRHVTSEKLSDGERYLVGLEFVEPSAAALEQIDRIVAARLAETKPVAEA